MLRAAGPLLLLQPSCLLAMIAILPRAISAPSTGSVGAVAVLAALALMPVVLVVRRALAPATT